jgi:chromosomal replication initiation ATPase DnaA
MGMGFVPAPVIINRRKIIAEVCREEDVTLAALLSKRRTSNLVRARWKAMHRLRELLNLSYPEIGRSLGHMDHSTVIHGIRQYEKLLASGKA